MIQQCVSASSCMRTHIVMGEHYTRCQHSTPFILNGPTQFFNVSQYTSVITVAPCCMNSTISTPSLSQRTHAISFLADVCLNFFGLSGECACINCSVCSSVLTQMKLWFHHLQLVQCD
jgi:hypothetical protein